MKKNIIIWMVLISYLFIGQSVAASKKYTLRLVTAWEKDFPLISGPKNRLADLAKERSNGRLVMKHVGGPELISVRDMLDALKSGQVDLAQTFDGYYAGVVPETGILDIPFNWSEKEQLKAFYASKDRINQFYREKLGCRILSLSSVTSHLVWTTKKPITKVEDFEGLKLRIPGGVYGAGPMLFKAAPVKIPVHEVITALNRGIIDGAQWAEVAVNFFHGDQALKYSTDFSFADTKVYIYISERAWGKLPGDLKNVLMDVAKELNEYAFVWGEKTQSEARASLKSRGVSYVTLDPAEHEKWRKLVLDAMVKKYLSMTPNYGKELLNTIQPYTHY